MLLFFYLRPLLRICGHYHDPDRVLPHVVEDPEEAEGVDDQGVEEDQEEDERELEHGAGRERLNQAAGKSFDFFICRAKNIAFEWHNKIL